MSDGGAFVILELLLELKIVSDICIKIKEIRVAKFAGFSLKSMMIIIKCMLMQMV